MILNKYVYGYVHHNYLGNSTPERINYLFIYYKFSLLLNANALINLTVRQTFKEINQF